MGRDERLRDSCSDRDREKRMREMMRNDEK